MPSRRAGSGYITHFPQKYAAKVMIFFQLNIHFIFFCFIKTNHIVQMNKTTLFAAIFSSVCAVPSLLR